jgi:transcriptional regulator with XRE-family HTH domain
MSLVTEEEQIIPLLEEALISWRTKQTKLRGTVSLSAFANELGASRSLVSMWMLGNRKITPAYRKKIAKPLADLLGNHVYEILEVPSPNPYLQKINQVFERLSPEHQQKLADDAERYEVKNDNAKKASRKRKTRPNQ